jgi:integrase
MAQIISRGPNKHLVRIFLKRNSKGKRLYLNRTITGTKKQAQCWARENEFKRDRNREENPDTWIGAMTLTVDEFLDKWLEAWRNTVRENTFSSYENLMRLYVRPIIGDHVLTQLRPHHVETLYKELRAKGLSGRTIRHVHARLCTAMNWGLTIELISKSPMRSVRGPRIEKKEMHFLSPEEAKVFLAATELTSWGLILKFALATGLRPEEYLGLQWAWLDLSDPKRGAAHVRRVVIELVKGGGWRWDDPKSKAAVRSVYFPAALVQEFKRHRIKQSELRLKMGSDYQDNDLVFATGVGTPIGRRFLSFYHFKPTIRRAGLLEEFRLYDLRHSYVTLSLLSGVPPKVVSEQAGHSRVSFTLDNYAHVLPEEREGASDKLERLLIFGTASG